MRTINALLIGGLAAAPQIADACSGSPPPPEPCVVTYACDLATPNMGILPVQSTTAASGQVTLADFPGFVYQETYNPDGQTCPTSTATLELFADCSDLIGKPSSELTSTFEEDFPVDNLQEGVNDLDLTLEWEFWDEGSLGNPGTLESGYCQLWATLLVEGETGITTVNCGNQTKICFEEQVLDSEGTPHPRVELTNTSLTSAENNTGVQLAQPGSPIKTTYRVTNWTDETFNGVFTVGSNNSNNSVVFEPDSEDDVGYTYTLSEGEGDDFPVEIVPDNGEYDPCFPLPTPATSIDPTGSIAVKLSAAESKIIEVYTRSWGNCANGSCSGVTASISGELATGIPLKGCASSLIIVNENGDGEDACPDGGVPSEVVPCGDDEPEGSVCYQELVSLLPSHATAGMRLQGANGTDLALFLEGTDATSGTATHETDVHNISNTQGRIQEDIHLGSAPSAGTTLELISTFKAQAGNAEGLGEITEFSIGDKYSPDETVAHSFIGLGEAVVAGNPNAMFQLQLQESIWAIDPVNGQSVAVPIESGGFEVIDDDQYKVTIRFIVPDSEAVSYVLTHDIRAFALTEFEIDCTDETDNDNDGLVDCDDDDCAAHPACEEDTGPVQTDTGDSEETDDSETEGCGCSSQPNKSSGILGIFLAAMVLCRRKVQ